MRYAELPKFFPPLCLFLLIFSAAAAAFAQNAPDVHLKIRGAMENRDYAAAVNELGNFERADKKIFAANNYDYLLARAAEKTGDWATAAANYQAVAARDSVLRDYAVWHLAQIYRASGNLFLEKIYLRKLLLGAPDGLLAAAARQRLPRSHFESGDYETAIRLLSEPAAATAKTAASNGAPPTGSVKPPPEDRATLVLLGQAFWRAGKTAEAAEIFARLVNNYPNPAQPDDFALAGALALDEMAVGADDLGKTAPALPDTEHFRRAQIYQFNRRFDLARLHYQAIAKNHPASIHAADALFQTGRGFAQERNFDQAINFFERVQAEFPDASAAKDALSQTAAAYARVNKPKESVARYQKFIEKYQNEEGVERAYLNLIDVSRDTGAHTEALRWAQKTQETFRGRLPEALALFAQARVRVTQNDWANALADLDRLQSFSDLGGARVPGGTNKAEIAFLKAFALENLNRPTEAMDVYLSIPDGRAEYYGGRATERLKALARDEKTAQFAGQKVAVLIKNAEIQNPDAQRRAAQAILRLSDNAELRRKMLDLLRQTYAALPEYQKIPNPKILELGRRAHVKAERADSSKSHQNLADELLFLRLYDEAAPELEAARREKLLITNYQLPVENEAATENAKAKSENLKSDFDYTLAVFYNRGDGANRAVAYIEPLYRSVPADYDLALVPREHLEMLYPAPYSDALAQHAAPRQVDARFLLAIMRQESRFRPDVKSNAAARGLLQFISTTSSTIAAELKRENFRQDELYDPPTAILFGAQYLSNLFRLFPNQPAAVAASYNGGEDNVARWTARSKSDDADRYVPEIAFAQSKDYVYKVLTAYRVYQTIYDENLKAR